MFPEFVTTIEKNAFTSLNCSIGWLGITAPPLCSELSGHVQQVAPTAIESDFIAQHNALNTLKGLGIAIQ